MSGRATIVRDVVTDIDGVVVAFAEVGGTDDGLSVVIDVPEEAEEEVVEVVVDNAVLVPAVVKITIGVL